MNRQYLRVAAATLALGLAPAPGAVSLAADTAPIALTIPSSNPMDTAAAGFGNRIPLRVAVHAIVPDAIAVEFAPGVDTEAVTSWQAGGRTRRQALDQALAPLGLVADYTAAVVRIALVPKEAPDIVLAVPTTWHVYPREHVADVLRRWAKQSGWKALPVFSTSDDWQTYDMEQEFTGTFEDALAWLSSGFIDEPMQPVPVTRPGHVIDVIAVPTGNRPQDISQGRYN